MVGPFMKLIEKYRCLRLLRSSTRECGSPSPRLEGGNGYPRPVGLAVHREKKVNDPRFSFRENFLGLITTRKVLGLITKESSET